MDIDPPVRRPRDPDLVPQTALGMAAKRRRGNSMTYDSAPARRASSPSPYSKQSNVTAAYSGQARFDDRGLRKPRKDNGTRSTLIHDALQYLTVLSALVRFFP
jgi:hypothetical protein